MSENKIVNKEILEIWDCKKFRIYLKSDDLIIHFYNVVYFVWLLHAKRVGSNIFNPYIAHKNKYVF